MFETHLISFQQPVISSASDAALPRPVAGMHPLQCWVVWQQAGIAGHSLAEMAHAQAAAAAALGVALCRVTAECPG